VVKIIRILAEYSAFIAKIHVFSEEFDSLEKGIQKAIKYCSEHGILNQFLEIYGSETPNIALQSSVDN